jgi:putative tryptophan/tyrosine transport system ATP-binding protein
MNDIEHFLAVKDVTVRYQRWGHTVTALDKISLAVSRGEWLVIAGHNGAGKSSLLNVISSRTIPQTGSATVAGRSVHEMSPHQLAENLFYVHQDPLLGTAPSLTLYENIVVADNQATRHGASWAVLSDKYSALLEPLGLADRLKQQARALSGGERQLLALFIARFRSAPIVLLDEPLAAIDEEKSALCLLEISALHQQGKTLVHVAHQSDALVDLADRFIVLDHGRIAEERVSRRPTCNQASMRGK